jgi:hypothetical protein
MSTTTDVPQVSVPEKLRAGMAYAVLVSIDMQADTLAHATRKPEMQEKLASAVAEMEKAISAWRAMPEPGAALWPAPCAAFAAREDYDLQASMLADDDLSVEEAAEVVAVAKALEALAAEADALTVVES